jgi:SPP1 family predicted phage head-tail adaptor
MSGRNIRFGAASLRHVVTVQNPGTGRDALGQPVTTWVTGGNVRCSIDTMQGNESVYALGQQAQVSHKITVRAYAHGITTASRLLWSVKGGGTRTFMVASIVDPENIDHVQHILAKEVVP